VTITFVVLLLLMGFQEPQETVVSVVVDSETARFPVADGLQNEAAACMAVFDHWWAGLTELPRYTVSPGRVESMKVLFLPDDFPDDFFEAHRDAEVPFHRAAEYERPELIGRPNGDYFWRCSDLEPLSDGGYRFSASMVCGALCGRECRYEVEPREDAWAVDRIGVACANF